MLSRLPHIRGRKKRWRRRRGGGGERVRGVRSKQDSIGIWQPLGELERGGEREEEGK